MERRGASALGVQPLAESMGENLGLRATAKGGVRGGGGGLGPTGPGRFEREGVPAGKQDLGLNAIEKGQ